jgi:predicted ATPase
MIQGISLTALGQPQEGLKLLVKGLSAYCADGNVHCTPHVLSNLAETHYRLGNPIEAMKCITEAEHIIAATEERYHEAELHRLRGDLQRSGGDHAAAEQDYRQALNVATEQSAKTLELRAATSLARLWRDQGKRTEAHDLLAPIYGWFTEGFDTPVLQDAKALLDEVA